MLLKSSLYLGNKFCMYFIDFVDVSLVSWIFKIDVFLRELFIWLCKFGKDVLSEEVFQVIILVSWFVVMFILDVGVGVSESGGGVCINLCFLSNRVVLILICFGGMEIFFEE